MCGPYGPRAPLRQQRRLEVDKSRKRDAQTGGVAGGPREVTPTLVLFFSGEAFQ